MQGLIVDDDIQALRDRADIVEVISGHMKLRKAGRVFKGLCCFHQEKTPSFTVDPAKQLYHCFGCGKGGDVFSFLREAEGLSFTEAAERLAARVGITLRYEGGAARTPKVPLIAATQEAAAFFSRQLATSSEAEAARRYLESRGFTSDDAKAWGLGYSPRAGDVLYRHLLSNKHTAKSIIDAGLALVTDQGQHRDRFRGRVMFPVTDLSGQVIGFGARALGDDQPKYLNSPETSIYHKSKVLFGLDKAREALVRQGQVIVTEGYTDVMALAKVGVSSAVATCGTALGEEHFALIKRFCERVILAFDADAAGAVASERGFGIHAKVGLEVLVAPIPDGKDPADVALTEGKDAVEMILEQAVPLMRFVLEREIDRHRVDTAEGKGKAVKAAAALLAWEPSRVARSEHGFWLAKRIGVSPEQVQLEIAEAGDERGTSRPTAPTALRQPGHVKVEREALTILIESPSFLDQSAEWLTPDHFTQPEHITLFDALLHWRGKPGELMDHLPDPAARSFAAELALTPPKTVEPEEVFLRLEEFRVKRQIDGLRAKLDQVDPTADAETYDSIFSELMRLDEQRRRFDDR